MKLSDTQLQRLQSVCLDLVKEVDRISKKNKIEYTLDGGTLLGAVREHGFIKWDDDADIAMTRDQYEKFFEACKKDLDEEKFFLQEYRTDSHYPWGYSKLRRNGTHLVQIGQEHLKFHDGIFIDIFVYDPVPDNYFLKRLHFLACLFIRKCQYSIVGKKQSKTGFLRAWYSLLDSIPKGWIVDALNGLVVSTNKMNTKLSSHKTFPYPRAECKYGLPRHCFNEYRDIIFENQSLRCMKEYDLYLSLLYGDYMTPTPPSERKSYPIAFIDFGDDC